MLVCWNSRKLSDLMFLLYCRGGLRVRHSSWKKGSENSERATGVRLSPITPSRIEQISTLRTGGAHWKSWKWSERTPKGQGTFSFLFIFFLPLFVHSMVDSVFLNLDHVSVSEWFNGATILEIGNTFHSLPWLKKKKCSFCKLNVTLGHLAVQHISGSFYWQGLCVGKLRKHFQLYFYSIVTQRDYFATCVMVASLNRFKKVLSPWGT